MAKRKKSNDIIQDTTAGDMMLDITAPDEEKTTEGLLRLERRYTPSDNMTVSWRIPTEVLEWAKEVARTEGVKKKKDIHYQKLIMGCFLDKYPLTEKD
jgi:hypothetical protein